MTHTLGRPGRPALLPPPAATGAAALPIEVVTLGACRSTGSDDLFFDEAAIDEAKAVCRGCPARRACLHHALQHERHGVWGGTTTDERDELRGAPLEITPEDRREADRLREALSRGVSQDVVADELGVNVRTVSRWWLDPRQPRRAHDAA